VSKLSPLDRGRGAQYLSGMMRCFLAALLLFPLGGCAVAAVGAAAGATWVWVNGEVKATLAAALPDVEAASRRALENLELTAVSSTTDKLEGTVTGIMADGTRAKIRLKAVDFHSTELRIRVGRVGDRTVSEQILRHIQRELPTEPAVAAGEER